MATLYQVVPQHIPLPVSHFPLQKVYPDWQVVVLQVLLAVQVKSPHSLSWQHVPAWNHWSAQHLPSDERTPVFPQQRFLPENHWLLQQTPVPVW